jgi:hypothetical protein
VSRVIDMGEWKRSRARAAKVRALIAAIDRYCAGQGPHDAIALVMVARRLTESSWAIVEQMAGVSESSALTRQLVVEVRVDRGAVVTALWFLLLALCPRWVLRIVDACVDRWRAL